MRTIKDIVLEHAEKVKDGGSTLEALGFLGLPTDYRFNSAGNLYLEALNIINKLLAEKAGANDG